MRRMTVVSLSNNRIRIKSSQEIRVTELDQVNMILNKRLNQKACQSGISQFQNLRRHLQLWKRDKARILGQDIMIRIRMCSSHYINTIQQAALLKALPNQHSQVQGKNHWVVLSLSLNLIISRMKHSNAVPSKREISWNRIVMMK